MINYFKRSFSRKKARRITKEYSHSISKFRLIHDGFIEFANWENPLVSPVTITQSNIDFFRRFIKKGDVVVDIGANIGDTTVPMAIAAGKEGVALGFDPNPYVFKILKVNAGLNKEKSTIIPLPNAVSVKEEDFYYVSSEASFANGAISSTKDSKHGKHIYPDKVKGVNLLSFLKKKNLPLNRLSFIKIDAEGYDKEIIKSISELIKEYKPALVAESFKGNSDQEKKELYDAIHIHGYRLFYVEDFSVDAKTQEIKTAEELTRWTETVNIYAVPEGRV